MNTSEGNTPAASLMGLGAIAILILGGLWAYDFVSGGPYSSLAMTGYNSRLARARASGAGQAVGHWSGSYEARIGVLEVGLDHFAFEERHGCGVVPTAREFGGLHESDGQIVLDRFYGVEVRHFRSVYVPVHWESRAYLVGEEDLPEFCSMVNGATYLPFAIFYKVEALSEYVAEPTVPKAYKKYLLEEPIHTKAIAIGPTLPGEFTSSYGLVRVTLNVGTKDGIYEGSVLARCGKGHDDVRIESATLDESVAVYRGSTDEPLPTLAWCFTTGGPETECQ